MPTYILLSRLSTQGVQTLKANPDRLREVNKDVEELGARVLHQWATLGEWDFVSVVEAPDLATVARVSVALGARGSTKIETLPKSHSPSVAHWWRTCAPSSSTSLFTSRSRSGLDLSVWTPCVLSVESRM